MAKSSGYTGTYTLDFEEPVNEIDRQIEALQSNENADEYADEVSQLSRTREQLLAKTYSNLTPWQTVRVARHPARPQTSDYIRLLCRDFCELHGDRAYGDDAAIICGFGSPNSSQRFAMTSSGGHAPGSPRQSMYRDRSRVSSKYRVP